MTIYSYLARAFLIIWLLMIWNVWEFSSKDRTLERLFRLTEISFFLLPLSAVVMTFVLGSQIGADGSDAASAGAAIGMAIGGTFVVGLAFVIGLTGNERAWKES